MVECHVQTPTIQIAGEIQQMYFKMGAAIPCYGWPHADIGDAGPGLAIDLDAGQVHPGQRHTTTLKLDIGGRRAQLARQFLPVQYPASDLKRTPQQALCKGEIAASQGITHLRAADAYTVKLDGLRRLDGKALHLPGLLQEVKVADAVAAKTEVVTDLQVLHTQAVDQDGIDEFGGAELAQALIERQAQHPVDTGVSQQLQLVAQPGQTCRRRVRGKELARLRLENHHAAGHAQLQRTLTQPAQDCLVTTVYTVKVANSGDTAPMLGPQIVKA